jgi:hypothetical protein
MKGCHRMTQRKSHEEYCFSENHEESVHEEFITWFGTCNLKHDAIQMRHAS